VQLLTDWTIICVLMITGRAYGVPEELDEGDLMNELDALEDEIQQEEAEETEIPSYLVNAASASKVPAVNKPVEVETDAFGLPNIPQRNLA
jgi:charged multivesicular body protein 5